LITALFGKAYNFDMTERASTTLAEFFSAFREIQFAKGETLLQIQDSVDGVFYLQEGVVNLVATSPKGEEVVVNVFKPGSFFPVQAVLFAADWKSRFSFVAAEDVVLIPKLCWIY
jgi:CRP-like cAMP-binding protein